MAKETHLDDAILEMYLLDPEFSENLDPQKEKHLQNCERCKKRLAELILCHDLLKNSSKHSLSDRALKLIEKIKKEDSFRN